MLSFLKLKARFLNRTRRALDQAQAQGSLAVGLCSVLSVAPCRQMSRGPVSKARWWQGAPLAVLPQQLLPVQKGALAVPLPAVC